MPRFEQNPNLAQMKIILIYSSTAKVIIHQIKDTEKIPESSTLNLSKNQRPAKNPRKSHAVERC